MSQTKVINSIKAITNLNDAGARKLLQNNRWNVQQAIDDFFTRPKKYKDYVLAPKVGDKSKLKSIFAKYRGEGEDKNKICDEKLELFFKDNGFDLASNMIMAYAVQWHLNCENMGEITQKEFVNGFSKHGADSVSKLKKEFQKVKTKLKEETDFKKFYLWVFDFQKDSVERKTLDVDDALQLWTFLLKGKWVHLDNWLAFVDSQRDKELKFVSSDLWSQLYNFIIEIQPDFSNMEEENGGAWPVALDEFVEWMEEKKTK